MGEKMNLLGNPIDWNGVKIYRVMFGYGFVPRCEGEPDPKPVLGECCVCGRTIDQVNVHLGSCTLMVVGSKTSAACSECVRKFHDEVIEPRKS